MGKKLQHYKPRGVYGFGQHLVQHRRISILVLGDIFVQNLCTENFLNCCTLKQAANSAPNLIYDITNLILLHQDSTLQGILHSEIYLTAPLAIH